jgi:GT2 family glycosyltransferase
VSSLTHAVGTGGQAATVRGTRLAGPGNVLAIVRDVEISEPLPDIAARDECGRRILRAWLLVRLCTEPLGFVMLDVPEDGLSATTVADAVLRRFGQRIRAGVTEAGGQLGETLPAGGLVLPGRTSYLARREDVLVAAPPITVVICTHERADLLARCLESVLAQEYPNFRVLVVDNAPTTDATAKVVQRFAQRGPVEYVVAEVRGLAHARNVAHAHAPGETLASIDDDEVADRYWLAEVARAFADHPEADVVTGMILPAELETAPQMWFEQFGGHSKGRDFTRAVFSPATAHLQNPLFPLPPFGAGGNMVFRAAALDRIGGFDVALGSGTPAMGGEDTLAFSLILRTGGTIVFQPTAFVRHHHRRDIDGLLKQFRGYGTGLTAVYTGLVLRQPLVLFALLRLAPRAIREVLGSGGLRTAMLEADFPRELLKENRRGLLRGPAAYLRGRRLERSRRSTS